MWDEWGKHYASDPYLTRRFPQDIWLGQRLSEESSVSVLEVGCGTGRLLNYITDTFRECNINVKLHGLDFSKTMLNVARLTMKETMYLTRGDAVNLPFKNNSFDWIYTHGCLMHLKYEHDVYKALKDFSRVVKKGIILIEEIPPDNIKTCPSGFSPNGLAYYWNYDRIISEMNLRIIERCSYKNLETKGCWYLVKDTIDDGA